MVLFIQTILDFLGHNNSYWKQDRAGGWCFSAEPSRILKALCAHFFRIFVPKFIIIVCRFIWVETYLGLQSETWCCHWEGIEAGAKTAKLFPKPPSAAWREAQAALPQGRVRGLTETPQTHPVPTEKYHWVCFPKKGSQGRGRKDCLSREIKRTD